MHAPLSTRGAFTALCALLPETLCHCEEGQLAPCGVPHAHLPRNAAGLDKTRHGMQHGLRGKLGCERMEGWCTLNVRHLFNSGTVQQSNVGEGVGFLYISLF